MNNTQIIRKLESRGFEVSRIEDSLGKKQWKVRTKFGNHYDANLRVLYRAVTL